jgi:hypothetical protein
VDDDYIEGIIIYMVGGNLAGVSSRNWPNLAGYLWAKKNISKERKTVCGNPGVYTLLEDACKTTKTPEDNAVINAQYRNDCLEAARKHLSPYLSVDSLNDKMLMYGILYWMGVGGIVVPSDCEEFSKGRRWGELNITNSTILGDKDLYNALRNELNHISTIAHLKRSADATIEPTAENLPSAKVCHYSMAVMDKAKGIIAKALPKDMQDVSYQFLEGVLTYVECTTLTLDDLEKLANEVADGYGFAKTILEEQYNFPMYESLTRLLEPATEGCWTVSEEDVDADNAEVESKQVGGDHYKKYAIQPMEFFHKNNIPAAIAFAMKYFLRYKDKGTPVQDLEKGVHCIQLAIKYEFGLESTFTIHNK